MVKASEIKGAEVPIEIIEAMNRTLSSIEHIEEVLPQILPLSNPQILEEMQPFQRVHVLFTLANITTTLFSLKLKSRGVNPDDHPVKHELDRIKVYQRKLEILGDVNEGPILPTTFLNNQVAVEDSLHDLSPGERQDMTSIMTNISIGEGPKMYDQEQAGEKRKYPTSEEQSVQIAVLKHVKKEPEEALGHNNGIVNEPIIIDLSDDDE